MERATARSLWHRIEALHAVTYFAPECRHATTELGLRGFWMGYFANRASPLGAVGAGPVEATFCNFHADRVRRAIPEAWRLADPATVVASRAAAAALALRRLLPGGEADRLADTITPVLRRAIDHGDPAGRPLFAANRDVEAPDDPVAALWQAATTLREHRGDGHVATLVEAGLDGCEVHVLFSANRQVEPGLLQESRGWSPADWEAARGRLADRGLVTADGGATEHGQDLHQRLERRTDELALVAYRHLGGDATHALLDALGPPARHVADAGEITFPNPMGLPRTV